MLCHFWQSAAQSCEKVSDTNKYIINSEKLPVDFSHFCLLIFQCHGNFFWQCWFFYVAGCWINSRNGFRKENGWNGFSLYAVTLSDVEVATDGRRSIRDFRFPQLSRLSRQVVTRLKGAGSGRPRWDWFRDRGMIRPAPVNGPLCLLLAPALTNHFPQAPQRSHQSWEGTDHFQGPLRTSHHPPKHPLAISDIFLQGAHMDSLD